ncbi:glutathione transferase omega-1 [Sporormia fimetaria CBS 119925]|uniref:Glutathione transferase omega-1 n=1 Tax=Sporormia fimetaria CBS 119925 TaxID=1340428 RepID=A0A6A6VQI4_9PLEO|nr:glutathione transferase omega-1 [Sporormia fimetaria CBS 119925]
MGSDHPDADNHPTATGPAGITVKAHSAPCALKLYGSWFCPFVQRLWIALEEKHIQYQYIEVNPYEKPKQLLDLNPRGLVPTLQWHDKPLYESSVLIEFIEDAFPDHSPKLMPEDPYERWQARLWTHFMGVKFIPGFHQFLQCTDEKEMDGKREQFLGYIKEFVKAMDGEGPYFAGKDFGAVDVMFVPWAVRFWVFDHFKGGLGIPEKGKGGEDEQVWERYRKWYEAVSKRKSVLETTSEREYYLPLYQRYAEDRAQSELAKATRKGTGVP